MLLKQRSYTSGGGGFRSSSDVLDWLVTSSSLIAQKSLVSADKFSAKAWDTIGNFSTYVSGFFTGGSFGDYTYNVKIDVINLLLDLVQGYITFAVKLGNVLKILVEFSTNFCEVWLYTDLFLYNNVSNVKLQSTGLSMSVLSNVFSMTQSLTSFSKSVVCSENLNVASLATFSNSTSTKSYSGTMVMPNFPQHANSITGSMGLFTNFVQFGPRTYSVSGNGFFNSTPGTRTDVGAVSSVITVSGVNITFSKTWFGIVNVVHNSNSASAVGVTVYRAGTNEILAHTLKAGGLFNYCSISAPIMCSALSSIYIQTWSQQSATITVTIQLLTMGTGL